MLQPHTSLKALNTFQIDAQARYCARIDCVQTLQQALAHPALRGLPRLVLGGGSNVLFVGDFGGAVLHMTMDHTAVVQEDQDYVWVRAAAGTSWHQLVLHCVARGYAGIENLSLIPGTVGAAPIQNIGAYGVELSDVFASLEALEVCSGTVRTFDGAACAFGYRDSVFKHALKDQYIILSVTLRLHKRPAFRTAYGDVLRTLEEMQVKELSIKAISDAVIRIRQRKLPDPAALGNAGSFFKSPIIPQAQLEQLQAEHPAIPGYKLPLDQVKVPAGWLIEQCGWKGKRLGPVGVHQHHALVLVHYGGGTGQDVYRLAQAIQQDVSARFGIALTPEVNLIGDA